MGWKNLSIFIVTLLFLTGVSRAQTLVDEAKAPLLNEETGEGVFVETIKIISASKKIFILTNNNQQLGLGDFISLALDNSLAARAIVAKGHDGQVGIKIIKIYSLSQWSRLRKGIEVQIIRGDDSTFGKKTEVAVTTTEKAPTIKTEEDLFNNTSISETGIDDLGELDDAGKRHIKPDNIISVALGFVDEADLEGGGKRATQFSGAWAYQFSDNWFGEFIYAQSTFNDFPSKGVITQVNNVVGRIKYNFKAPLYSFIMPYIGFQQQTANRDSKIEGNPTAEQAEQDRIDELKKIGPVFGVTLLRRLVPGWFVKADLGSDIISVGVAIEF
jgi:hypothetical protein